MKTHNNQGISKSQIEVWEWKESIHQEIKNLSIDEGLKYIINKANKSKEILQSKENTQLSAA